MAATVRTSDNRGQIRQHRRDGVVILRPLGKLDRALADDIRECALESHDPVVIDLADCVLIDPAAVRRIAVGCELYPPNVCLVCHRRSGRRILKRVRVDKHLAVFERVEQAIAAHRRYAWTPR